MNQIVEVLRGEGAALRDTPWGPAAVDCGDWQAEYRAFRDTAGVFAPPSMTQVEIAGSDRAAFLNRLATNKLDRLQPGDARETFLADASGRILFHVFVFSGEESLVLETAAGLGPSLCAHLDHYWIREDLKFFDRSSEWGTLVLAGPQASEIVQQLPLSLWERAGERENRVEAAGKLSPPAPLRAPCAAGSGEGSILANFNLSWNGQPLMVRRFQERGFQSYHLACDAAEIALLWQALRQRGAAACGMKALETVRIEEGFPVIGLDITDKNLPQEVGRNEKAISFTKGCYLGQEVIARIDARGAVGRVLCGLRFETAEVPPSGGELTHDGQPAGQITSAAYSPGFQACVALAYVRRPWHEIGAALDSAWGRATVVELPMRPPL